jgi:zinc-ribbon domain
LALTCARCGAQNPDGNQFCQACGTPLMAAPQPAPPGWTAAPPQGPPASTAPPFAYASPPPAPVAYASPYYSPTSAFPQAPVHRTPWILILAAIFGLIVLMAGCGTAIALFNNGKAGVTGTITADVPSPTPAGSLSPVASPITPTGPTASNAGMTVPVPAGWVVDSKDNEQITLADPSGAGVMTIASAQSSPTSTAEQQKSSVDQDFTSRYPDTKPCPNIKTSTGSLSGQQGIFWTLCFTLISGSQSFSAAASLFVGVNADGSVFYGVILLARQDNLQNFLTEAAPVLKGIQWKLK